MDAQDVKRLILEMRQIGNDTQSCEVKEAGQKIPSSIVDTLSAFSNGNGGIIILGVSEKNGFTPVPRFNARAMQEALSAECDKLTPSVRPDTTIIPFEGVNILVAEIQPMPTADRPCYVTARGRYQGSYIRTGDGDRRLTQYEVDRMIENHMQPRFDDEIVSEATIDDLDHVMVSQFLARQRMLHPRIFASRDDQTILVNMHVAKHDDHGILRPTLGGIMALGSFPQQFFPRLNVTFTAFAGVTKTETVDDERRFLDASTIVGPIPMMIDDALNAVAKNMKTGAVIEGAFRKDMPDYPLKAVREAVANALMHRDYSPDARGSQVQVNLYADRLEILNPGGLYGNVTIDNLGTSGISSSRNQFLSNILETTPYPNGGFVVENRGTGYQVIEEELQNALMPEPKPLSTLSFFSLTFDKRRVTSNERQLTNTGSVPEAIVALLRQHSSASTREMVEASGLSRSTIAANLRKLVEDGIVEPTQPGRSPKQRYRLTR
ncbi:ATP-binding protein [Bifidobacterium biavatii]|uniref:Transcriptional regulator n=1 Tax=Bifidobacterium biavatii DSM 23969 TaxID=1437608 RepID=A0A086ZWQ6_9BIFI|nr:ATP-binding protein [Bifidobacterium biavatii]KFI50956.1 transcriptional regulator [Bifidobacterium biavatii DSM 23969]